MAKSKNKRPTKATIEINIIKVTEYGQPYPEIDHIQLDYSQTITFDFLVEYYEKYLERVNQKVLEEYEMQTLALDSHVHYIKIQPNFELSVEKLMERGGTLMLIIKSKMLQIKKNLEEQIATLRSEVYALRQQVRELLPLKQQMESLKKTGFSNTGFLPHQQSIFECQDIQEELDIAILFSEPLYNLQKKKPTLPAVDFRSELARLYQSLEKSYKPKVTMKCEIATVETLKNLIKYSSPKILHIICHGNSDGFLEFQDDSRSKLGVLHLLKVQDLKFLLKDNLDKIPELVFVNSCHSEKIGNIFFDIGVKFCVMINSEDTISDEASQIFSEHFFRNIFRGENVVDAFLESKKQVQINHTSYQCCCSHKSSDHRQNCRWKNQISLKYHYAHRDFHVPSNKCKCSMRNFNRHKLECEWARKVLFEINQDFRKLIDGELQFPKLIGDFPDYFDVDKRQLVICCCPIKDKVPHNESDKFKIRYHEDFQKQPLFTFKNKSQNSEIRDFSSTELAEAHEKEKIIYGRQRQLFALIKNIREYQQSLYLVYGQEGVGMTTFTIKAASYLMERRCFEYFFFIDIFEIKDQHFFRFKFNQVTKFDSYRTQLDNSIKTKKNLFLFDNCDDFLKTTPRAFYFEMQKLQRQFPKSKIIVTIKKNSYQNFDQKQLHCCPFELQPLDSKQASALFNMKLKDKTDISVGMKEYNKLVKTYDVLKIPKAIESLSQSFSEFGDKATYAAIEEKIKQVSVSDTNKLTLEVLETFQQNNKEAYEFLIFISQFSEGVSFEDLNIFSTYDDRQQSSFPLPVKKNWPDHYRSLFQNQQKEQKKIPHKMLRLETAKTAYFPKEDKFDQFLEEKPKMKHQESAEQQKAEKFMKVGLESFFVEEISGSRFIVKRFIRDFVWNKHETQKTYKMKFLFVVYFSVVLQLLFSTLSQNNFIHQQLITYSLISESGVFAYETNLQDTYRERKSLTQSVRMVKQIISDIEEIFTKNQLLLNKLKNEDPSIFILNHQEDYLKIYDYEWDKIYDYMKKKGKNEEKIFICFLQNLIISIPTALKIAHAQQSLIKYVISRSETQLHKMKLKGKQDHSFRVNLKLAMIKIGVNLKEEVGVYDILQKTDHYIQHFCNNAKENHDEYKELQLVFLEEKKNIQLYFQLNNKRGDAKEKVQYLIKQVQALEIKIIEPIIRAKQQLLICLNFLQYCHYYTIEILALIKQRPIFQERIFELCQHAIEIFRNHNMKKLQLKSNLARINLFWELNSKFKNHQLDPSNFKDIDKWRQRLQDCSNMYSNPKNKLGGFTEFDEQIKKLKKQMKEKLWKSAEISIIFMKAYPISLQDEPCLANLVRKKNDFRKTFEAMFKEKHIQYSEPPKLYHKQSKRKNSIHTNKKQITLDISAKYEILSSKKLEQEVKSKCTIMVISTEVKILNGKVFMVFENDLMGQNLVEIDRQFARQFDIDKVHILILVGPNTELAMKKIEDFHFQKQPYIISLNSQPIENQFEFHEAVEINSELYREFLLQQSEIREQQMIYLKYFIKKVVRNRIEEKETIFNFHERSISKHRNELTKITPRISYKNCQNVFINYKEGTYKDLSPGYERNHNLPVDFYQKKPFILRKWREMQDLFAHLQGKPYSPSDLFSSDDMLFNSGFSESNVRYINVFGEIGSGKTYFINQIAKILVERELYDYGVYLFDGKEIENRFYGDFESYIKKQAKKGKMPVYEDFEKILGQKTILIIDDFDCIKSRTNARLKLFLDKIIVKKVSLIMVSINELKIDWINNKLMKIKIHKLNSFETDILAYNMLNLRNQTQIKMYETLKKHEERILTTQEIRYILENCESPNRGKKQSAMKKVNSYIH